MKLILLITLSILIHIGNGFGFLFPHAVRSRRYRAMITPLDAQTDADFTTMSPSSPPSDQIESHPSTPTLAPIGDFVRSELKKIIRVLVKLDTYEPEDGLKTAASNVLIENAHILCKGREYEKYMSQLIKESSTPDQISQLERINALCSGFIQAERRGRARMKVNYILAGATTNRLEDALQMLSETEEVDEDLIIYLDYLIEKTQMRTRGMESLLSEEKGEAQGDDSQVATLEILQMIQRRLRAELTMKNNDQVRLLSSLLAINDSVQRLLTLTEKLNTVEKITSFASFLQSGIEFVRSQGNTVQDPTRKGKEVELPGGVLEKMKDLLLDLNVLQQRLETGLGDNTSFQLDSSADSMK